MTLASFSGEWGWLLVLFGFLLAIANKLLMRHPTWLIARQKLLLRIPIMGSLMRGQKLTQIFTILTLTQSAGIFFFYRALRASEKQCAARTGCNF